MVDGAPQMTLQKYLSLSYAALREPPKFFDAVYPSIFCRPLCLAPFTVPCKIVFAMPEDLEMWPYHPSFRFFTMVRRSSCTPVASWILLQFLFFVENVQKSPIASHLKGLDLSVEFCCQGPALIGIEEGRCDCPSVLHPVP